MIDLSSVRESGLDVVLLGVLVAGIGASAGIVSGSASATPSFVRFFQVPKGTTYPAALPQDKALLLLTDPRTADAAAGGVGSSGGIGPVLVAVGVMLVALGLFLWRGE
ncbi:hypothetical protein GRX01_15365 [Halobaculum sp. WSA2]|uniref:Uncharacterized protein n=1 Tax=Halobaculum saliterrae TaxID=2073113 RepID=A0A6B0T280_9EURY|nr:hypothetical protein [Halobaculum saliterrae]MXR42712.1 hypothetical protein [Halobaculum saliterrae]